MRVRTGFETFLVAIAVSLQPGCTAASQQTEKHARIVGEVVTEVSGKTQPRPDFAVYLFTWQESGVIRDWLQKLDADLRLLDQDPDDSERRWIVEKRAEDIYRMVVAAGPSHRKKTDKHGNFAFEDLAVGQKYLVIGAELEHAEGHVLLPQVVGPLVRGENKVRLVEG